MVIIYIYALASVLLVSLFSFAGALALSIREDVLRKYLFAFISLAIGAMLGDAFIHIIPEALESSLDPGTIGVLVIGGILFFFVLEKFLHWHHHGEDREEAHIHPVGQLVLFSDGVHNFIDGMIIGASFLVNTQVGMATTLAVILHEIPQEIGDFAVLLHAGYSKNRALWLNFLSAVFAILGLLVVIALNEIEQAVSFWFLPIAAGSFIYIAIADLIPELHKTKEVRSSISQICIIILGVLAMLTLTFLE
ncbi:hypothetical protein A3D42_02550 [Candidatus Nomurabacteria bacterium RIFCSPHIGHO2_02_FULL_41_18]|uniref:ZIP family metal transporter n=1 Tax=Candidatus Nomurabacteria bacterium RIFCSPHIGHO2_02_FULL_41_18 TaxID=1801754 RepID=A0A1F6W5M8_9BACT|nr:MAG: hypothetical protein A2737_01025 [Candidatus Nomurabacteria bacterium RIFCSPHIGHO2_01_FULL_41_71]OGI76985.1 MAG: hypothetical protein A3D42_02550 [Candidatus Nomurabacteria bacterium RIFCSPHIGHO2_02_FULL_41_18]OGI89826.1 MAG: hypothetical protein A3B01_03465 [Candidatus Nomurabacteria bacterium RIFCSPLOWO2_01_FULL_41_52b]OGJ00057.1 MAG: hypothetical protein A3I90_02795 [Candidatus Nomurabacteria bacterium RIFCSPLOWO2_02_FULL_41_9]